MAERDLAGNRDEAHQTQCPSRALRVEADFNQVFRLVHLHQIPGQQSTEIAERQPPEAPRAQGSRERPINRSRAATREPVGRRCDRARRTAVRLETQIGRLASQQQIERCQRYEYEEAKRPLSAIKLCSQGRIVTEPTPAPENAMLSASPRRRTNQLEHHLRV